MQIASSYVNVVTVELPDAPKDLEQNDHAHLNEPRQKPSSRVDLDTEVDAVRRGDEQEQKDHVHASPVLHRVPNVRFKERRIKLSGISTHHAIDELKQIA